MNKYIFIVITFFLLILFGFLAFFIFFDINKAYDIQSLEIKSVDMDLNDAVTVESENLIEEDFNLNEEVSCSLDDDFDSNGCSVELNTSNDNSDDEVTQTSEDEISTETIELKENLAYDFELKNLEGEKVRLSNYRGKKPVIVEFWNLWCHNCQREMPKLQKTYEKYDGKFEIIGVNLLPNKGPSDNWDSKKDIRSFVDKYGINFPIVFDKDLSVAKRYKVKATNHHFLINLDGTIYDDFYIDLDDKKLEEFLKFNGVEL